MVCQPHSRSSHLDFEQALGHLQGDNMAASQAYEALLDDLKSQSPVPEEQFSFVVIKYARFRHAAEGTTPAALSIIKDALQVFPYNRVLWESAMHLAEQYGGQTATEHVQALLAEAEAVLKGSTVPKDKAVEAEELALSLAQHAFGYLDEVAAVQEVRKAEGACAALTGAISAQGGDKKRKAHSDAATGAAAKSAKNADGQRANTSSAATTPAASTAGAAPPAPTTTPGSGVAAAGSTPAAAAAAGAGAYYGGQGYGGYPGYAQPYPMYPASYQYGQGYQQY
jgi:hypothetical protein